MDKISIVSTGGANGSNLGASRVTGDVVNMLAQVPAVLEALTGVRMSDLMERVPGLRTVEGSTTTSESGDVSPDGTAASNGAKDVSPAPTVQRIKVPAPETDPSATTSSQANQANPTNNSTGGTSSGPTAGPRKQPVR